jgi:hypothetical protein
MNTANEASCTTPQDTDASKCGPKRVGSALMGPAVQESGMRKCTLSGCNVQSKEREKLDST